MSTSTNTSYEAAQGDMMRMHVYWSGGDKASASYTSATREGTAIYEWLVNHGIHHLAPGFVASLGGIMLSELLCLSGLSFGRLLIEGVCFYSGGRISLMGDPEPGHGHEATEGPG